MCSLVIQYDCWHVHYCEPNHFSFPEIVTKMWGEWKKVTKDKTWADLATSFRSFSMKSDTGLKNNGVCSSAIQPSIVVVDTTCAMDD